MTTKGQLITLKSRISILHPVYMQVCKRIINGAFFRNLLFCSNSNFAGCFSRACLKNHSSNLHAAIYGIFCLHSVAVARYASLIQAKSPANGDAHFAESIFQTRSILINIFLGKKLHFAEVDVSEKENNSNNLYDGEITDIAGNIARKNKREPSEDILDLYGNAILRLAYSYLHNLQDSEDILQETLIRYIQKAPPELGDNRQKAWLLRVASNLCKDRIRYKNVHTTDELKETLADEKAENLSFVWDAVKSLPVKYREVIHLFYHEGYSTKEISAILERNESTVRSDLRRGRQQLKNILKEEYDFE